MTIAVAQHLNHAENRIRYCDANALHWENKDCNYLADKAKVAAYWWIGRAQEQHQEDHF